MTDVKPLCLYVILSDARCVPTDKSEADILAWDDAGTRDDEIRTIRTILQPFFSRSGSDTDHYGW